MREMNVRFPLFAFEKDDHSMFLIEEPDRLLYHLEWIDIEDQEYIFWDSTGAGVRVTVNSVVLKTMWFTQKASPEPRFSNAFSQRMWG
jgi:hypothetical protein